MFLVHLEPYNGYAIILVILTQLPLKVGFIFNCLRIFGFHFRAGIRKV